MQRVPSKGFGTCVCWRCVRGVWKKDYLTYRDFCICKKDLQIREMDPSKSDLNSPQRCVRGACVKSVW